VGEEAVGRHVRDGIGIYRTGGLVCRGTVPFGACRVNTRDLQSGFESPSNIHGYVSPRSGCHFMRGLTGLFRYWVSGEPGSDVQLVISQLPCQVLWARVYIYMVLILGPLDRCGVM
jgi:hypothetical protein